MGRARLALLRWIDSWAGEDQQLSEASDRIDWVRVIPFLSLHVGCLAVVWVGFSWTALYACVVMYLIRMFAITAFYHRFFSHRAFRTSRPMQFVFAVLGNSAAQRGPLWWAAHHRHHHRHSDTPEDVHSPGCLGFWRSHVGWILAQRNFHTRTRLVKDLARYPELVFLDRFDWLVPLLTGLATLGLGYWLGVAVPQSGTGPGQMFVWAFLISTVLVFHATCAINSLAHMWGSRRYENADDSRNNWVLALITLGEGWHNNHHRFPGRVRQGVKWWEIDLTYLVLKGMAWAGLIWDLNAPPDVTGKATAPRLGYPR